MNPDEPLRTKNLAEEDPAPMDDTLGGYPWLPRMIDKARAAAANSLGRYYKYPCPIDSHCLARLGLTADGFSGIACGAKHGIDVLEGIRQAGGHPASRVSFDPIALNRELHDSTS